MKAMHVLSAWRLPKGSQAMQCYLPVHLPIYPPTCHLYLLSHLSVIFATNLPTHLPVISIYHLPTYPLTCLPYPSACLPINLSSLSTCPCTYHLYLPPPFLLTHLSSLPTPTCPTSYLSSLPPPSLPSYQSSLPTVYLPSTYLSSLPTIYPFTHPSSVHMSVAGVMWSSLGLKQWGGMVVWW